MRVAIVNCFDTYEERVDLIYNYFKSEGHIVSVVQSDFRHFQKIKRKECKRDFIFVECNEYYKNLSIKRMKSHYKFAKDAFEIVKEINPDILYVMLPPNSLAKLAAKYKKEHKDIKLYFDIIDLWPETMPLGKIKLLPPFMLWKTIRDNSFNYCDCVITECNLYNEILKDKLKKVKTETLYLAKQDIDIKSNPKISNEEVHLCYLGSINNIIDIDKIRKIIKEINDVKPTTLHIIGDGEKREKLIDSVRNVGANVEYHGKIYDSIKKQKILDKCHFGLNIMKDSVCVGLTMKSIDYFQNSLPIINNIPFDTTDLIRKYEAGLNINEIGLKELKNKIELLDEEKTIYMKKQAFKLFTEQFKINIFKRKLDSIINKDKVLEYDDK